MSGGSNNPMMKYVLPSLETVGGAVSEWFAPGNPIGIGLMGSGIGQLAGGSAGGSKGQSLGGMLGGLAGMGGGMLAGGAGSAAGSSSEGGGSGGFMSQIPLIGQLFGGGASSTATPSVTDSGGNPFDDPSVGSGSSSGGLNASEIQDLTKLGMSGLNVLGGVMGGGQQQPQPPSSFAGARPPAPTPQAVAQTVGASPQPAKSEQPIDALAQYRQFLMSNQNGLA